MWTNEFFSTITTAQTHMLLLWSSKHKEADLSQPTLFCRCVHARVTPKRLPPVQCALENADVYALMRLVFTDKTLSASVLSSNWPGTFNAQGFPLPHRKQLGRPARVRASDRVYRCVTIMCVYTLTEAVIFAGSTMSTGMC